MQPYTAYGSRMRDAKPPPLARGASLAGRVHAELLDRLQRGDIGRGDRLVDTQLAQSFGTSRMPVREALLRLVSEGFLTGTTRGFQVPQLSLDEIRDVFEVRRLLEPRAAAHAARAIDAAGLDALAAALGRARAAHDAGAMIAANMAFRAAWLAAVPNRHLAGAIGRFVDHVQAVRLGTLHSARTQATVVAGLDGLFDAFARHDARAAQARMSAFVTAAERAFFEGADAARAAAA